MLKFNQFVEEIAELGEDVSKMSANSQTWYRKGYEMGKNPDTYKNPPYGIGGAAMDAFRKGRKAGEEAAKKKNEEVELDEWLGGDAEVATVQRTIRTGGGRVIKTSDDSIEYETEGGSRKKIPVSNGKVRAADYSKLRQTIDDSVQYQYSEGKDGIDQHPEVRKRYNAMLKTEPDSHERRLAVRAYTNKKKELRRENEEAELDEISKKTLGSYVKKAGASMASHGVAVGSGRNTEKSSKAMANRMKGMNRAADRLSKEEVELDEISDKKLDAYRQKAFADQPAGDDGSDKYRKRKRGRDLAFAKQTGRAKVLATKEEVELDEISKKTLGSYVKKAGASMAAHGVAAGAASGKDDYNDRMNKASRNLTNRLRGIHRAADRLAKEGFDDMDAPDGPGHDPLYDIKYAIKNMQVPASALKNAKQMSKIIDTAYDMEMLDAPKHSPKVLDPVLKKNYTKLLAFLKKNEEVELGEAQWGVENPYVKYKNDPEKLRRMLQKNQEAASNMRNRISKFMGSAPSGLKDELKDIEKRIAQIKDAMRMKSESSEYEAFKNIVSKVRLKEGRNEALKALEKLASSGGIDKEDFQKAHDLYKANKLNDLRKHIYRLDTSPSEEIADVIHRHDSKAFNSMYPRAKSGDYIRKIVIDHGGK